MSLQFILGPAGAGKTTTLFEELIRESMEAPGPSYFALVPEQFTLQTQADIVRLHPRHGTMELDIVSFERLAYRVFEELGVPSPVLLDDMGKTMVLRKVASAKGEDLGIFRRSLSKVGFLDELKSVLSEFCQYRVGPEQLARLSDGFEKRPMLQEKLRNLQVLYEAFQGELAENTIPKEELLHRFCQYIPKSELIRNSVIALDGFTGFTPVQTEVLRLLLRYSKKVTVTLTLGTGLTMERVRGESDLFYMSKKTWELVRQLAREEQVEVLPDRYLTGTPVRFRNNPELALLERKVGRFAAAGREMDGEPGEVSAIRICEAANPKAEAAFIAGEIRRLVREEGLRYREIAVVVGAQEAYSHELEAAFGRNGIPCFLDGSRSLIQNPLATFLLALLEVVEKGFEYEAVFRCLKSGFLTKDTDGVDRIENYVLRRGFRGIGAWEKEWADEQDGRTELRKQAVAGPLMDFYRRMKEASGTVQEQLDLLFSCLQEWDVPGQLGSWQKEFEAAGDYSRAKEYEQAFGLLEALFEKIGGIMGKEKLSLRELREVLNTGLEETRAGVIPAGMDQVLVCDMTRSRLKDIHVLFFAGMNDGLVPAAGSSGGVLSDLDREQLKAAGVELKPTDRENSFIQKFYFYLAVTKPDRQLILSYSKLDGQGKSRLPSSYLRQLEACFPGLKREELPATEELSVLTTMEAARRALALGLRRQLEEDPEGAWKKVYGWFLRRPEEADFLAFLREAGFYCHEEGPIGAAVAKALYGEELSGSVTRLEQYAACAYAWFLQTGLALSERKLYGFEARDMGNLFHMAIEIYFRNLQKDGFTWNLSEERRRERVAASVKEALLTSGPELLEEGARNRYLVERLTRITDRTIWALMEQGSRGDFVPEGVEVNFSAQDTQAMNLWLTEEEILRLRGKIDRIDVYEDGDRCYVKIIDYKSGTKKFDLAAVYYGLQLQLVLYLDAAMETEKRRHPGKEILPAGIFYYHIDDPLIELEGEEGDEERESKILEQLRMSGLSHGSPIIIRHMDRDLEGKSAVLPVTMKDGAPDGRSSVADTEQFAWLRKRVREEIQRMGRSMLAGEVPVYPYKKGDETGCDYCMFKQVCGFDTKIPGYRYRKLPKCSPKEIWEIREETREKTWE